MESGPTPFSCTGHTHHFALQNRHLVRWAGIHPDTLQLRGHIRHSGKRMPLLAANLWLHHNENPQAPSASIARYFLQMPIGIAVYPDDENYPRLPLLGLRAMTSNNLYLTIDGEHASVTLRTPDWRTRLFSWLG